MNSRRALAAMFLLGAATLLFEVLLARLLAIALFANLAFAAIAIALLGFALGGWLASRDERLDEPTRRRRIRFAALVASGASLAACLVLVFVPLVPAEVFRNGQEVTTWSTRWRAVQYDPLQLNWVAILLATVLQALPFASAAYAQGLLLASTPERSGRLYAAELTGACLGAWSSLALLPRFGAENSIGVSMLFSVAAACAVPGRWPRRRGALALLFSLVAVAVLALRPLSIRHAAGFSEARVLDTAWTSMARVSLFDWKADVMPGNRDEPSRRIRPETTMLLVDNASRTRVARLGDTRFANNLDRIPLSLRPSGDVLIIGAGGGLEISDAIATALPSGRKRIDAVEVAAGIPTLMWRHFGRDPDFILSHPSVAYHVADGRSFVELSRERWAVIQMKEVNFHSFAGQVAASWSPSLLFTVEAFKAYLQHLSEGGILSIVKFYAGKPAVGQYRLLATLRAAGDELGVELDPRVVVLERKYGYGCRRAVFMGRDVLSPNDLARLEAHAVQHGQRVLRSPRHSSNDEILEELLDGSFERAASLAYAAHGTALSATRDDRPFGNQHLGYWSAVMGSMRDLPTDPEFRVQIANYRMLTAIIAGVALATMLLLGLFSSRVDPVWRRRARTQLALFACLGMGFMLFEIVLVERASVLLGHPTAGLVCVLTALLLALGAGSALSELTVPTRSSAVRLWVVVAAVLAAVALLPTMLPVLVPWLGTTLAAGGRAFVAGLVMFVFAVPLGSLLPSALRVIGRQGTTPVSSCWAANGASSVLGTVAAALLIRTVGFTATALTAWVIYGLACVLWLRLLQSRPPDIAA